MVFAKKGVGEEDACLYCSIIYWAMSIYVEFFQGRKPWASVNWLSSFIMMLLTLKEAPDLQQLSICMHSVLLCQEQANTTYADK